MTPWRVTIFGKKFFQTFLIMGIERAHILQCHPPPENKAALPGESWGESRFSEFVKVILRYRNLGCSETAASRRLKWKKQVVRKSSDQELTLVMYAVYKGMNNYSQIYRYNNKPLPVSQSGFHGSWNVRVFVAVAQLKLAKTGDSGEACPTSRDPFSNFQAFFQVMRNTAWMSLWKLRAMLGTMGYFTYL